MSAKRALVVDDSKSARAFLNRLLDKHGLEVDTAESAEDALEYLAKQLPACRPSRPIHALLAFPS